MSDLLKFLVVFLGVFTQSLTGFGSGLVSMAFLPTWMPVRSAAPLTALVTGSLELMLVFRYRNAFNLRAVAPLAMASIVGIPLGGWALRGLNEDFLLGVLGAIMAGYALYALFNFKLPQLNHPLWAPIFGFLAGLLSGAYSTGGPPVIIYGHCRRWQPEEFKSNLQGFFLVNDALTLLNHGLSGNLTPFVWQTYMLALPAILLGMWAGSGLVRSINPLIFRRLVLILLVLMGFRFML
jgi:hypothetical protein